jgi:hypothetical protein
MTWVVTTEYDMPRPLTDAEEWLIADILQVPRSCVRQPAGYWLEIHMPVGTAHMSAIKAGNQGLQRTIRALDEALGAEADPMRLRRIQVKRLGPEAQRLIDE